MKIRFFFNCLLITFLSGCSAQKFLSDDEKFYGGAEFEIVKDTVTINENKLKIELEEVLEPKPNNKLLFSRPGVWFHYKIGEPEKEKGLKQWMKKNLAVDPILNEAVNQKQMFSRLKEQLHNEGFFRNKVTGNIEHKKFEAKAIYNIETGPGYIINSVNYPKTKSIYDPLLQSIKENSLVQKGDRYSFKTMQAEQKRIENYLENSGFYYFNDNYLVYLTDSTLGSYKVDLTLKLSEDTPEKAKYIYTYSDVIINPQFNLISDSSRLNKKVEDINNYRFINNDNYIRPDILTETVVFEKGDIYSEEAQIKTRERLMSLGTYKYVNLKFSETDSAQLKSEILLTPLPKKSIRLDLQAVSNSNNFVGPKFSTAYQDRNAFRGAELFELKLDASYEVQIGGQNDPPLNAYELNLETSLTIPRLITPFNLDYRSLRFIPQTRFSLGMRQLQRLEVFEINTFESQYGFIWQESYTKQHQFFPISISYLQLGETSEAFDERLEQDPNLSRSLEDQFILGAQYEYTFSSKNAQKKNTSRNNFYFNGLVDISGNLANGIVSTFDIETSREDGFRFSQYAKLQLDFRHFKKIGSHNEFATRFLIGGARAYGNSSDVPFVKQFSSGGSNSLRAFRARSVGPGAYINDESGDLIIDETGDIKIETSIEYRASLGGIFESAFFIDAGNIWLWEPREELKPNGAFDSEFIDDLVIGTGLGLRLDFSFFLLRFDLAFPIRKTTNEGVDWVFDDIDPVERAWRRDNLLLNIAIGYPF